MHSAFTGNSAGGGGGALSCVQGVGCGVTVTDSTFTGNSALSSGGAIRTQGGTSIVRCVFVGNTVTDQNGSGGAVSMSGVSIADSAFVDNSSIGTSGAVAVGNNAVRISGSTFEGNHADHPGGAVAGGVATITNSTFSGNTANSDGGAIYSTNGLTLNNLTITGNTSATGRGGGISAGGDTVRNSIVAGNTDGSGSGPECFGVLSSQGHNLVGNDDGCSIAAGTGDLIGTAASPIDPLLGPLQPNGGPTSTLALLAGSPALDAGDPAVPGSGGTACEATDQRGATRPVDGDGIGSAVCDIGAYERLDILTTTTSTTTTTTSSSTSSSTPTSSSTSSTTLPAGDCASVPDGPTFASILCRLEALLVRVNAESGLGAFQPKLAATLTKARDRTVQARDFCCDADGKHARQRLKQVLRQVIQYAHRLSGHPARKKLDPTLRTELLAPAEPLETDLRSLRNALGCPTDALAS